MGKRVAFIFIFLFVRQVQNGFGVQHFCFSPRHEITEPIPMVGRLVLVGWYVHRGANGAQTRPDSVGRLMVFMDVIA